MATSKIQELAEMIGMLYDEFIGEMCKCGCSQPIAIKIRRDDYENFDDFQDNDIHLSILRKAAFVLKVNTGMLFTK